MASEVGTGCCVTTVVIMGGLIVVCVCFLCVCEKKCHWNLIQLCMWVHVDMLKIWQIASDSGSQMLEEKYFQKCLQSQDQLG